MFVADIKRVVEQISRDKGIDRTVLIKALEEALKSAARKRFGSKIDIEVKYDEDSGEIEVFQFKEVVAEITEPDLQMSIEQGMKLDPECEVGDFLGTKMDTSTFGRIAAQSAKQVIIQKMKDAERDAVYSSYIDRKGEIINGIVQRIDRGDIIVNLGHTEGILPLREQVSRESYRRGDRVRALILDILYETRGPQIVLSRTHPDFLIHLFKMEVPEISEGIVTIMGASREPGVRAKIAVASNDSDIDPVGACVGMKGSRVQNVVQELRGEKIDIIPWHVDPAKFVCNALAPAEISRVIIDEDNRTMEVIVPDEYLSIAIGKRGQNVRLASKLTRWHLDVISEERYSAEMKSGYDSLVSLPSVGISLADTLYEQGFFSAEELTKATVDDLVQMIRGISEEEAETLLEEAAAYVEAKQREAEEAEQREAEEAAGDAVSEESAEEAAGGEEPAGETSPEAEASAPADSDKASPENADETAGEEEPAGETSPEAEASAPADPDEAPPENADETAGEEESAGETAGDAESQTEPAETEEGTARTVEPPLQEGTEPAPEPAVSEPDPPESPKAS